MIRIEKKYSIFFKAIRCFVATKNNRVKSIFSKTLMFF